ncbi:MAG: SLBB domain-containing protein [Steroidobacteraceae bacterium]
MFKPAEIKPSSVLLWAKRAGLALLASLSLSQAVLAQTTPTAQQLETFRSLPADQQQAILNSLSNSNGAGTGVNQAPLSNPVTTTTDNSSSAAAASKLATDLGPPKITGASTLILSVEVVKADDLGATQKDILSDRQARILAANPYLLDSQGRLTLPFLPAIALKGLKVEEAAQRLNADPRLAGLAFKVSLLPLEPVGVEALKPYGYDLFSEVPTTFAPATDIPVSADYIVGPGDTFIINTFGKTTGHYSLVVSREGQLQLPGIGPMQVAGLRFENARDQIEQRITQQSIGVQVSVTMGELRSIRVFITGDVKRPGSYTVSGLSTMTNALFASGGISNVGSLRNIQLKRNGANAGRLDLYDLLLSGDSSDDRRLLPGDVLFVPPVGVTAGITGQILRPALYELKEGQTIADLLALSGGLVADADPRVARLERIDAQRQRTVLNLDLTQPAGRATALRAGDVLTVPKVLEERVGTVSLEGYVQRPGQSAWRQGMRLTDLVGSLDALKLNADQRYVLIRREHLPDRRVEVLSADLSRAFNARGTQYDPALQSGDRVFVFSLQKDRGTELGSVLNEVKMQVRDNQAMPTVFINGRVRSAGEYPLQTDMKVSDLLRAGGGLDDSAFAGTAELTRFEIINGEKRQTEVLQLDLSAVIAGNVAADRELKPYDVLTVQRTPEWYEQGSVVLRGEVKFPGTYPLRKGETLRSVIERAGGLTDDAYAEGTVFTRVDVQQQQQQQIDTLTARMQTDMSLLALQTAQSATTQNQNNTTTLSLGQSLLSQLRSSKASGRLVVDLKGAMQASPGSDADLRMEDGDTISVPKLKQFVAVVGEVQNPTAHVWRKGESRDDYVNLSGGTTRNADKKRIYVVRADGSVSTPSGRWFGRGNVEMKPGDTVVAPLDAERMRPLPLWTSVTQIIYNLAIAAAAVASF